MSNNTRMTITLTEKMKKAVTIKAKKEKISAAAFIRNAVESALK